MSKYPVLIGGVGLIKGRIKNIGLAMVAVCDEVKPIIEQARAFEGMPFKEINMIIRWNETGSNEVEIGPLRNEKQSLEASTTISLSDGKAVENNPEQLVALVKYELTKVLAAVEEKYGTCHVNI